METSTEEHKNVFTLVEAAVKTIEDSTEEDACCSGFEREDGGDDWGTDGGVDWGRYLSSESWLSTISVTLDGGSGGFVGGGIEGGSGELMSDSEDLGSGSGDLDSDWGDLGSGSGDLESDWGDLDRGSGDLDSGSGDLDSDSNGLMGGSGGLDVGGPHNSLSGVDGFWCLGVICGLAMAFKEGSVFLGVLTSSFEDIVWLTLDELCK